MARSDDRDDRRRERDDDRPAKKKHSSGFVYKDRGASAWNKRANQRGGTYDSYIKDGIDTFSMKEGDYNIRLMPPTWDEDAEHCGYEVVVHHNVGADQQSYLCLQKMLNKPCPVCEEQLRAEREGDEDYAKSLKPSKKVVVWMIDRDERNAQPRLWTMPWTVDRDLGKLVVDKKTGKVLVLDHPDEGYDIEISKEGKGKTTKYGGMKIAREATPLSDDEDEMEAWLTYIKEHPIPDCLNYYEYDHIAAVFAGGSRPEKEEDADEDKPKKSKRHDDDDDDRASRRTKSLHEDDDDAEEKPAKRGRDEDDDDKPKSRKARDDDDDATDDDDRRKSKGVDDDDDDKPKARNGREDDDDDVKPTKRARVDDDDEPAPRSRPMRKDDDDDDKPATKTSDKDRLASMKARYTKNG